MEATEGGRHSLFNSSQVGTLVPSSLGANHTRAFETGGWEKHQWEELKAGWVADQYIGLAVPPAWQTQSDEEEARLVVVSQGNLATDVPYL